MPAAAGCLRGSETGQPPHTSEFTVSSTLVIDLLFAICLFPPKFTHTDLFLENDLPFNAARANGALWKTEMSARMATVRRKSAMVPLFVLLLLFQPPTGVVSKLLLDESFACADMGCNATQVLTNSETSRPEGQPPRPLTAPPCCGHAGVAAHFAPHRMLQRRRQW